MKRFALSARTLFSGLLLSSLLPLHVSAQSGAHPFTIKTPFKNAVFVENKGQFDAWNHPDAQVLYGVAHGAETYRFTHTGVYTRLFSVEQMSKREREREDREREDRHRRRETGERMPEIHESFVGMEWIGANANATVEVSEKQEGYFTYAVKNPATGALHGVQADAWKKITYRNIYPGIDAEYIIPEDKGGIKYSLIIHPGADPSVIKIRYTGDVRNMQLGNDGAFEIKTADGTIREMAPESFYEGGGSTVNSNFLYSNRTLSFSFPQGYDSLQTLIIDPWVVTSLANLTTANRGYDVDLNNSGELYVYGGGDPNGTGTPAYEVAKYSTTGALLWTFGGVIAVPSWSSSGVAFFAPGNFLVERTTGKTYLCQAYSNLGSQVVRLDASGNYDNFISIANNIFEEGWDMAFDCNNGQIYAIGGGTTSNINFGVVNTTTGVVNSSNITGTAAGAGEDVLNVTMDPTGTMFCIIASGTPTIGNYIYRVNNTFNGNVWNTFSGYPTFTEGNNKPYNPTFFSGNGFNCLAANSSYLFYYDGFNLKAFDKNTGAAVGAATTLPGYSTLWQGGIAVDDCNNLYVGGIGQIHMFTFNGANFTQNGTIGLGAGLAANHVHDIRYDMSASRLFVCGESFAGVYSAVASGNCNNLQVSATVDCAGNGTATVTTTITNPVLNYTWYNSSGNPVSSTSGTTSLIDNVTGLSSGTYVVTVQINPLCGGPLAVDTIQAGTIPMSLTGVQNVSCFGLSDGTATATVTGGSPPITYSWNTVPAQNTATATGLGPGNYSCTVTDATGCTATLTLAITQPTQLTGTISGTSTQCGGAANPLSITPGGGTPTYTVTWNPGGGSGNNYTVNPNTTTTYTATITDQNGCTHVDSFLVTVTQSGNVDLSASPGGCAPWNVNFTDLTQVPVGGSITAWQWDFGDGSPTSNLQNPSHVYTTPGNYVVTLIVTFTGGCTGTATLTGNVNITGSPTANFSVTEMGGGDYTFTDLSINATTWQWDFGDNSTSVQQNPTHTYDVGAVNPPVPVTLIVSNPGGCSDTITIPIDVRDFTIYIPNTFTPNSNGLNDGFIAQGVGIVTYEMWIFDRWGMMLYHCTDINAPWDGTYKGRRVQVDTYVYKIKVGDVFSREHNFIGHVNVVR